MQNDYVSLLTWKSLPSNVSLMVGKRVIQGSTLQLATLLIGLSLLLWDPARWTAAVHERVPWISSECRTDKSDEGAISDLFPMSSACGVFPAGSLFGCCSSVAEMINMCTVLNDNKACEENFQGFCNHGCMLRICQTTFWKVLMVSYDKFVKSLTVCLNINHHHLATLVHGILSPPHLIDLVRSPRSLAVTFFSHAMDHRTEQVPQRGVLIKTPPKGAGFESGALGLLFSGRDEKGQLSRA
ncbi:hypothetical protein AVEN_242084-1 [Araneus ventricosus]|uniref:Uncharacterized protein n=1 Tax=Araneus ventricosus TaxID=182803 RepID=A0A4Y2U7R4_ARAVE|nr:hypothetical protein AVEN_108865-1 [Araneus ventricosus]GBO07616.1 hypothetical protein AVEN_242084-1 [Araneus ventricosus]